MVDNCNKFHLVLPGSGCQDIAAANGITLAQFLAYNTDVGGSACTKLWANAYVCVGIIGGDGGPTPSASATATPDPTGCTTAHPSPTQPGSVCDCIRWHEVVPGQTCLEIQERYRLTPDQFLRWNPNVGPGCTGIWAHYLVCVRALT